MENRSGFTSKKRNFTERFFYYHKMIAASELRVLFQKSKPTTEKLFSRLKRTKPSNLDNVVHELHYEVFENTDCLKCANCCKTTSPIFYDKDIERLSKHLKVKPSQFIDQYLHIDEDKDYVLNSAPSGYQGCPFLDGDNYCTVYDARPTACREYPHTNRKRFYQILDLTLRNTEICPAAYEIVEKMKSRIGH